MQQFQIGDKVRIKYSGEEKVITYIEDMWPDGEDNYHMDDERWYTHDQIELITPQPNDNV